MNMQSITLFFSAGEISGDQLGASLAADLLSAHPDFKLVGMGGDNMQQAGVTLVQHIACASHNGFLEILRHLPAILALEKKLKAAILAAQPSLLILIDYQGLNLRLAKFAKSHGIRTLFYVSPQIWASRYHRIEKIRRHVDHMAVLYQFEKDLYDKENIPATFVGHPLQQQAIPSRTREENFKYFQLDPKKRVITLLPGSRPSELKRLLPVLLATKAKLQSKHNDLQFTLLKSSNFELDTIQQLCPDDITIISDDRYNLFSITDTAIATSGTVTLELGLMQVPMVVIYKVSALTAYLVKHIIKTNYICLCNILLNQMVVKELLQNDATPEQIVDEAETILMDNQYRNTMISRLGKIKENMGQGNSQEAIYKCIMQQLSEAQTP